MSRFVVLVGTMGSGKTTVGAPLAERLGRRFVDNDEVLTRRAGRSAADIVSSDGADALHREEAAALLDALGDAEPAVVAAAGSVVDDDAVRERLLREDVDVVWLRAHPSTLRRRALAGAHRPFVHDDPSAIARLDGERRPRYQEVADVVVDVDDREAADIVNEITNELT